MTVKSFDSALDFIPATKSGGPVQRIKAWFAAVSEGIRLASDYKILTSHGVAPDVAVRRVFDTIKP